MGAVKCAWGLHHMANRTPFLADRPLAVDAIARKLADNCTDLDDEEAIVDALCRAGIRPWQAPGDMSPVIALAKRFQERTKLVVQSDPLS
jgi:hypothetical protein